MSLALAGLAILAAVGSRPAPAQRATARPAQRDTVVLASKRYSASSLHRRLLGEGYRDLWATPIRVPILDVRRFAGGLTPTKTGGGAQTRNLRLEARDGREFVFRPVHKELLLDLENFEGTIIEDLFADALSASHPTAPVVAPPFLDAVGIPHPTPRLVVMPDDPLLGEFRKDFAGQLGTIEEFPSVPDDAPGFAGAVEIIDSDDLLERLNGDPAEQIDARALLRARLVDMLIGDNDRHPGQWKWARRSPNRRSSWVPIPRDRDKAMVSHDGLLLKVARRIKPNLVSFEHIYPSALFRNAIEFDRRLLVGLDRAVWDSTARSVVSAITDAVIDSAMRAMPSEYRRAVPELASKLRSRRRQLPHAAARYYQTLFAVTDLQATDKADRAGIRREYDGSIAVELRSGARTPWLRRRFVPDETRELRVYLHGGADTAMVTGFGPDRIVLRVIGGAGEDALVDAARGPRTPFLDVAGQDVRYKPDSGFNRRPWVAAYGRLVPPPKDRGTSLTPTFGIKRGRGLGITPQVGVRRTRYAFETVPYANRIELEVAYSASLNGVEVELETDHRFPRSRWHVLSESRMSQLEVGEFRGFGNDVPNLVGDFYRVRQRQWRLHPAIAFALGPESDVSLGPIVKYSTTDSLADRFISDERPYGFGRFGQAGVQLQARYDSRDARSSEERESLMGALKRRSDQADGFAFELAGSAYPGAWSVRSAFAKASAVGSAFVTVPVLTHPVLALRAGGERLWGAFPYFEAAFLGGSRSLRTARRQRFAGDAVLHAAAELRVPVAEFAFLLPLNVGVIGFTDAGRVYMDGRSPGGWHTGAGGGLWLGVMNPGTSVHALFTNSRERRIVFGLGFDY
jgi:hypothetical protein